MPGARKRRARSAEPNTTHSIGSDHSEDTTLIGNHQHVIVCMLQHINTLGINASPAESARDATNPENTSRKIPSFFMARLELPGAR